MSKIAKAITAGLTAFGIWGGTALLDGRVSSLEAVGLIGIPLAALAVWAVPNKS